MVQKVFWLCAAKTGTQIDDLMPAREIGQAKTWKDVYNESYFSKKGGFLPRMREDGKLKGKKRRVTMEGLEKASGGVLRWEVSWRRKGSGTSPKRECWKTEEPCPEKTETCSMNIKQCVKKTFSAGGCERKVKKKKNKEATEEESKSGTRKAGGRKGKS